MYFPKSLNEEENRKHEFYKTVHLWALNVNTDWIKNFSHADKKHAYRLLENFIYINDAASDHLIKAAFKSISNHILDFSENGKVTGEKWKNFVETVKICPVNGELPSITDSAYTYLRKVRRNFGLRDDQFISAEQGLRLAYNSWLFAEDNVNIVFIDDFIGSGDQFISTWTYTYDPPASHINFVDTMSYRDLSGRSQSKSLFFYCTLIGTKTGISSINDVANRLNICCAYELGNEYNALDEESIVWKSKSKTKGLEAIKRVSLEQGMDENLGKQDWRGYKKQGLVIAIRDMVPDASLGILGWDENNWTPIL